MQGPMRGHNTTMNYCHSINRDYNMMLIKRLAAKMNQCMDNHKSFIQLITQLGQNEKLISNYCKGIDSPIIISYQW